MDLIIPPIFKLEDKGDRTISVTTKDGTARIYGVDPHDEFRDVVVALNDCVMLEFGFPKYRYKLEWDRFNPKIAVMLRFKIGGIVSRDEYEYLSLDKGWKLLPPESCSSFPPDAMNWNQK